MSDEILTIKEAAAVLKISIPTLYRYGQDGVIATIKGPGKHGSVRFYMRDIEAYARRHRRAANRRDA